MTIDGTAPSRMTAYIVASVKPNQMIAAGTQATDGSDCRPVMIGPNARRRSGDAASADADRDADDDRQDEADGGALRRSCSSRATRCRPGPSSRKVCQASAGLGSAYGGLSSST